MHVSVLLFFFFFNDTATTEIYTLSLHDALPISFAEADDDYFRDMDGGVDLDIDEMKGRNVWMLWSAGNDRFWDWLGRHTGGGVGSLENGSSLQPPNNRRH